MRKIRRISFYLISTLVIFLSSSLLAFGITLDDPLLKEIEFNKEESVLSGTTVPAANVSLVDVVTEVVADEEGHFELPVPADLEKSQIRVDDYIEDQSTTIEFDFKNGQVAEVTANKEDTTKTSINETTATSIDVQGSTKAGTSKPPVPSAATTTISPWLYVIIALVLVFVGLLLYFLKRQQDAKKEAKLAEEASRKKKKRRRKKKSKRHYDKD